MPNILVIKPSSLGDIVHGLLVAQSIREQLAGARIHWIARDLFAPLVRQCTTVDVVHEFRRHDGLVGFVALMREVRRHTFDHILDFQGLLRTGLMARCARGADRIGRTDSREMAGLFYARRAPLPLRGVESHAVDILARFNGLLGIEERPAASLVFRPSAAFNPSLETYAAFRNALVLFPATRRAGKRWEGFPELTTLVLQHEPGARVVWAGDEVIEGRAGWSASRFLNLTGRTSLDALPDVVRPAALVVGNDSGPMHLAAAMGRPVVALFGPTDPVRYGPYPPAAPSNRVIRAPLADLRKLTAREVFDTLRGLPAWADVAAGRPPRR